MAEETENSTPLAPEYPPDKPTNFTEDISSESTGSTQGVVEEGNAETPHSEVPPAPHTASTSPADRTPSIPAVRPTAQPETPSHNQQSQEQSQPHQATQVQGRSPALYGVADFL